MNITIGFSKQELAKIAKSLKKFEKKQAHKIVKKAIRKGSNKIKSAMRANAPKEDGTLKKSIKVKMRSKPGFTTGRIGTDPRVFPQAFLVEFGHKLVLGGTISSGGRVRPAKNNDRTGKGRVIGQVGPNPFGRKTYAQVKGPVIESARQEILKAIELEAAKLGAKNK